MRRRPTRVPTRAATLGAVCAAAVTMAAPGTARVQSPVTLVDHCGHAPHAEQPAAFLTAAVPFLAGPAPADAQDGRGRSTRVQHERSLCAHGVRRWRVLSSALPHDGTC